MGQHLGDLPNSENHYFPGIGMHNDTKSFQMQDKPMNFNMTEYKKSHWCHFRVQEKEMQKSKMAVWGGLTNSCEKNGSEKQRRKGKIDPIECRVTKNSKER